MPRPLDPAVLPRVLARYAAWEKVSAAVDAILPVDVQGDERRYYIQRLAPDALNDIAKLYVALVKDLVRRDQLGAFATALFTQSSDNELLRAIMQERVSLGQDAEVSDGDLQSLRSAIEPFLNSNDFLEGMEAARFRVCAVWVDDGQQPAGIRGTGFLVAPDLVLTAHHVVSGLLVPGEPRVVGDHIEASESAKAGSGANLAFVFEYWWQAANLRLDALPAGALAIEPADGNWLEWSSANHPSDGLSHVFGDPDVATRLDCAVIRLSSRVGASVTGRSRRRVRGWERLNGAAPKLVAGRRVMVLQHPAGGPQVFDSGIYHSGDPSKSRLWYETESAGGSSGSPCFSSDPMLVGFHNAGRPKGFKGNTELCNQGVRIDRVIAALPPGLLQESKGPPPTAPGLWSLTEPPAAPDPVLGRAALRRHVDAMSDLGAEHRVLVVEQAPEVAAVGQSGKSTSVRILRAMTRDRPGCVVEFQAKAVCQMEPEAFLAELGRRIGIESLGDLPEKPQDERQATRWWAVDLPRWFGARLEERAQRASTALSDAATGVDSVLGPGLLLRELVWIAIDDIHLHPPESGMKELIAGMMAITDTQTVVGPGLRSLRWLLIGRVPDFVRERSIEYRFDAGLSQMAIGEPEYIEFLRSAWLAHGRPEAEFPADRAKDLYLFAQIQVPAIADQATRLPALAQAAAVAMGILLR